MGERLCGIYAIKNVKNGKHYIGQSVNINKRIRTHFAELRRGVHKNELIQNDFNEFGENSFMTFIVEQVDRDRLDFKEIEYISYYNSYKMGYNKSGGAEGSKYCVMSDEQREFIKNTINGEGNPNYGNKWTDEQKKKASELKIGMYAGDKNPRATKIICVETGKKYNTMQEAALNLGIKDQSSIGRCLKSKYNVAYGYHFVLYDDKMYQILNNIANRFKYLCECYAGSNAGKYIADLTNLEIYTRTSLCNKLKGIFSSYALDKTIKEKQYFEIDGVRYKYLNFKGGNK